MLCTSIEAKLWIISINHKSKETAGEVFFAGAAEENPMKKSSWIVLALVSCFGGILAVAAGSLLSSLSKSPDLEQRLLGLSSGDWTHGVLGASWHGNKHRRHRQTSGSNILCNKLAAGLHI